MKVLIVPSWYPNDCNRLSGSFFKEQAEALAKNGMDVIVFALNPLDIKTVLSHPIKSKLFRINHYVENNVNTYVINIPTFGLNKINAFDYLFLYLFKKYFGLVEQEIGMIDIIHAHSYKFAGYAICKLFKYIPKIVTEHTSNIIIGNLSKKDVRLLRYVIESADKFICVSNSLKNSILNLVKIDKEILVIPNPVNEIFSYACVVKNEKTFFVFLSVSNLVHGKKVDILIKAFSLAFKNNKNVRLKIAGDGPERKKLNVLINQLGMNNQIELLGQVDRAEVLKLYHMSNAFVMVSAYETFGIVYAESLMCGLPTIGTKNGGAEDILNCYGGFLCEVDDIEDIAKKMQYVVANYSLFDRKKIFDATQKKYSQFHVVRMIKDIYDKSLRMEDK